MAAGFGGLFSSQKAIGVNQAVLNVISNNIANANTPGYSRQRAELETTSGMPVITSLSSPNPGQVGSGVEINNIIRIRDKFIDNQYRLENLSYGFLDEKLTKLENVETFLQEPSDSGILARLDDFFNAASEVSNNPESLAIRNNFLQKASDLAYLINEQASQITALRTDLVGDVNDASTLDTSKAALIVNDIINPKLSQIAELNQQIIKISTSNANPNELMDKRDQLLDEISEYLPLTMTETENNGITINLGSNILMRNGVQINEFAISAGNAADPATISLVNPTSGVTNVANVNSDITNGRLGAILELGGSDPTDYTLSNLLAQLDTFASELATAVNTIQTSGQAIDNTTNPFTLIPAIENIFEASGGGAITATNITINQAVLDNPYLVAAADGMATGVGDRDNAIAMSQLRNTSIAALGGLTLQGYITNEVSSLGQEINSTEDNKENKQLLIDNIDTKRQSVAGVNLDEEFADLIRFQRAYEASAKMMSVLDNILDTLINRI